MLTDFKLSASLIVEIQLNATFLLPETERQQAHISLIGPTVELPSSQQLCQ